VDEDNGFHFIFAPGEDYPIDFYRPAKEADDSESLCNSRKELKEISL
jgi:hypothetical protein